MKRLAVCCFFSSIGVQALADECAVQVNKYIDGIILPVKTERYVSKDKVDWAKTEVNRVMDMRRQMPDCEVARQLSHMSHTNEQAVEENNQQIAELEKSGKQSPKKPTKKDLYRY